MVPVSIRDENLGMASGKKSSELQELPGLAESVSHQETVGA